MVRAEPPTPVGAFSDINLFPSQLQPFLIKIWMAFLERDQLFAGLKDQIPGEIILLMAYPDREIVANPASGKQFSKLPQLRRCLQELAECHRFQPRRGFYAAIKGFQEV